MYRKVAVTPGRTGIRDGPGFGDVSGSTAPCYPHTAPSFDSPFFAAILCSKDSEDFSSTPLLLLPSTAPLDAIVTLLCHSLKRQ